jgi:hypothetical protein
MSKYLKSNYLLFELLTKHLPFINNYLLLCTIKFEQYLSINHFTVMKNNIIIAFCIIIMSMTITDSFAQESSFNVNVGYPSEILGSGGAALFLSANYYKSFTNRIGLEAQVAYTGKNYENASGLFTQNGGKIAHFSANAGARFYLNGLDKKHPIYINGLLGYGRTSQEEFNGTDSYVNTKYNDISLSMGAYIALRNKIILGISIDGMNEFIYLTPKVGFNFNF